MSAASDTWRVSINIQAGLSLKGHVAFLAKIDPGAARRLKEELLEGIKNLNTMPFRYPVFITEHTECTYRKMAIGRYLILYRIEEAAREVLVEYIFDTRTNHEL